MKPNELFEQLDAIGIEADTINKDYIKKYYQLHPILNVMIKDRIGIFSNTNVYDICIVLPNTTLNAVIQTKLPHDLVEKHLKEITQTAQNNQEKRNENA